MKNNRSRMSWLPLHACRTLCVLPGSMFLAGAGPDKVYTLPTGSSP